MRISCLISNYNYAHFVSDAIESALAQTVPFDEIIVVDDGSSDGSVELLRNRFAGHRIVQIVAKENQGQLSCFNEGFARSTGDVVFFLDADDVYEPDYVEQVMGVYHRDPDCDFVFCKRGDFGQRGRLASTAAKDHDLGYSVILTAYRREWIGASTSCLSMRRHVLDKLLPMPAVEDWRVRADDCLVFGASLAGARKHHLAGPLVRCRIHGGNGFRGRRADPGVTYRRRLAINRLFEHLERKFSYNFQRLADFHHREFCTIARPSFRRLTQYLRIGAAARVSPWRQLECAAEMVRHYVRSAMATTANAEGAASTETDPDATTPWKAAA